LANLPLDFTWGVTMWHPSMYGAAGSIIIILIWVYYSAIILYFGAEFTKVYALTHGQKIIPNRYSVQIQKRTQFTDTEK